MTGFDFLYNDAAEAEQPINTVGIKCGTYTEEEYAQAMEELLYEQAMEELLGGSNE